MSQRCCRLAFSFSLYAAMLATAAAASAGTYTVVDLTPHGYEGAGFSGASGTQQAGSVYLTGSNLSRAALWNGTAASFVDLHPIGYLQSQAIGTSGVQQAGYGVPSADASVRHALVWSGTADSVVDLNPSGFLNSTASGASGAQQVGFGTPSLVSPRHALLWSGTAASAIDLNPSGFFESQASGISGDHQVGFGVTGTQPLHHALLWSGTAASAVDLSGGADTGAAYVFGSQQVGATIGTWTHALLWNSTAASKVDLHPDRLGSDIGSGGSAAYATNGIQQVGALFPYSGGGARTVVWRGTPASAVDLQSFLPATFTGHGSFATAIDSAGNVFGSANDSAARAHAIEWMVVPEPSGLALLGLSSLGLLGRRRVR